MFLFFWGRTLKYSIRHIFVLTHKTGSKMKKDSFILFTTISIGLLTLATLAYCLNTSTAQTTPERTEWQLTITGLVQNPTHYTLADLEAMPQTSEYAIIFCVDFPNTIVTQGTWTGVQLSYLLTQAGIDPTAIKIAFTASDGFSTDLTIEHAMQDDVILALQKDGEPLTEIVRLVVPNNWGYKWINKLTTIELVNYNYLGRWESRGYPDQATINTNNTNNQPTPYNPNIPVPTYPIPASPSPTTTPQNPTQSSSPSASPQQSLTPNPTTTQTPSPTPSLTSTTSPSPYASPTSSPEQEPDASSGNSSTSSDLPYLLTLAATLAIIIVITCVAVLRKQKKHSTPTTNE